MSARITKEDIAHQLHQINAALAAAGAAHRLRVDYAYGGAMLQAEADGTGRDIAGRTTRSAVYEQLRAIVATVELFHLN